MFNHLRSIRVAVENSEKVAVFAVEVFVGLPL